MKAMLLHSENSGVAYYRVWQQAKYLERMGWEIVRLPDELPEHITTEEWAELGQGLDIIVTQRADNPDMIALCLALADINQCPLVYEIDDNIYDISKNSPSYEFWQPGSPLFDVAETFMRNSHAMTVSTPALAEVYDHLNGDIAVLRNCQDPEDWKRLKRKGRKKNDPIVIGWAGSFTHYDDLRLIRQPIKKILRNHPNVVFRVLGCLPDFLEDVERVEFRTDITGVRDWPKKLAELNFDIGLVPLVDRPFNRGKSNIKWQEYSMLEIPTVASKLPEFEAIKHGETGLLASSPESWVMQIEKLIESEELRRGIGQNAKAQVLREFNIVNNVSQWDEAYRRIIKGFVPNAD